MLQPRLQMRNIDLDKLLEALGKERDSLQRCASQYYESSEKYEMMVDFLDRLAAAFEQSESKPISPPSQPSLEGSMRGGEVGEVAGEGKDQNQ